MNEGRKRIEEIRRNRNLRAAYGSQEPDRSNETLLLTHIDKLEEILRRMTILGAAAGFDTVLNREAFQNELRKAREALGEERVRDVSGT